MRSMSNGTSERDSRTPKSLAEVGPGLPAEIRGRRTRGPRDARGTQQIQTVAWLVTRWAARPRHPRRARHVAAAKRLESELVATTGNRMGRGQTQGDPYV